MWDNQKIQGVNTYITGGKLVSFSGAGKVETVLEITLLHNYLTRS